MKDTWEYKGKKFEWSDNPDKCDAAGGCSEACKVCPHAYVYFNPGGDENCFPGAWKEIKEEELVSKWHVCQYFDDHYEGIISTHKTKEEAEKARNKLTPGVYVSYEVREKIEK